ncbi:hypothetical protein AOU00_15660 [Paenibacillus polymyxa]|nr:hypothetical protein AOU00_15660 [Paenibacillus polymyxa]KYG93845.1 hypothetical protein AZE31_08355 [Paenibacillus polymyxa]
MDLKLTNWEELQSSLFRNSVAEQSDDEEATHLYEVNTMFTPKFRRKSAAVSYWTAMQSTSCLNLYHGVCWTEDENVGLRNGSPLIILQTHFQLLFDFSNTLLIRFIN